MSGLFVHENLNEEYSTVMCTCHRQLVPKVIRHRMTDQDIMMKGAYLIVFICFFLIDKDVRENFSVKTPKRRGRSPIISYFLSNAKSA